MADIPKPHIWPVRPMRTLPPTPANEIPAHTPDALETILQRELCAYMFCKHYRLATDSERFRADRAAAELRNTIAPWIRAMPPGWRRP